MLIAITGTAGVGKSTLASRLASRLGFAIVREPVDPSENPWLPLYYERGMESMKEYRFPLDLYFLSQKAAQLKVLSEAGGSWICDQHFGADYHVFARGAYQDGLLSEQEWSLLGTIYRHHLLPGVPEPDLVIHLTGTFEGMLSRVIQRNRQNEMNAPLSYWKRLYDRTEQFVGGLEGPQITRYIGHFDSLIDLHLDHLIDEIHREIGG